MKNSNLSINPQGIMEGTEVFKVDALFEKFDFDVVHDGLSVGLKGTDSEGRILAGDIYEVFCEDKNRDEMDAIDEGYMADQAWEEKSYELMSSERYIKAFLKDNTYARVQLTAWAHGVNVKGFFGAIAAQ